jgi:TP901 family phage tail tape measure protein
MSETLRDLVVSLSLQTDNFTRNIKSVNTQIKEAESAFKLAASGVTNFEQTTGGLAAKQTTLTRQLNLQKVAVDQYQKALEAAKKKLAECQANQATFEAKLASAKGAGQSAAALKKLEGQVTATKKATQNAADAVSSTSTKLNNAQAAVRNTQAALNACNGSIASMRSGWTQSAQVLERNQSTIAMLGLRMRTVQSEFTLATAGIKNTSESTTALTAKLKMLDSELTLQQATIRRYEESLAAAKTQLKAAQRENDPEKIRQARTAVEENTASLNNARAAYVTTQQEIRETNRELTAASNGFYTSRDAVTANETAVASLGKQMQLAESKFRLAGAGIANFGAKAAGAAAKLQLLKEKQALLRQQVQQLRDAVKSAEEQLKAAQASGDPQKIQQAKDKLTELNTTLNNTEAQLRDTTRELNLQSSAWTRAGVALTSFSTKARAVSSTMVSTGRTMTRWITTPLLGIATASVNAEIQFEKTFATVRKTVRGTGEDYARLEAASKKMSTQLAAGTDEINAVMSTAGQLGIATENIESFTKTMIDLGNSTTDLDANTAATEIAKFINIMGTSQKDIDRLGASLAYVGNRYATTEAPIMEMAMRIAGAGKQVGMTEAQVIGVATALSSVGIEAQMGGSAFSKALIKMELAAETGGQSLTDFATVSGMTAEEFKNLWKADPTAAFIAFTKGIAQMDDEGISAIATLQDLGFKEVRLRDTMLRTVSNTRLMEDAVADATRGWQENTALTEMAGKIYATTAAQLTNLKNKASLAGQQIASDLTPTIQNLMSSASDLLDKFMGLDEEQRLSIIKWGAVAAAMGPALLILGRLVGAVGSVAGALGKGMLAVGKFSAAVKGAGGGVSGLLKVVGSSKLAMAGLTAAVIYGAYKLYDYASGAKAAREALEGMNKTAQNWKNTAADTFYSSGEGLDFFGLNAEDFQKTAAKTTSTVQDWMDGMVEVWSDGKYETDAIVKEWQDSSDALSKDTRAHMVELRDQAQASGDTAKAQEINAAIAELDALDKRIRVNLNYFQGKTLTDKNKAFWHGLMDQKQAILLKWGFAEEPEGGTEAYDTIAKKVRAAEARAAAMGQEVDSSLYQEATLAASQGYAAVLQQMNDQYDAEYEKIIQINDATERNTQLTALNEKYTAQRAAAAKEFANASQGYVTTLLNSDDTKKTEGQLNTLLAKLKELSDATAAGQDTSGILTELNTLTQGMDEGALTEYLTMLTQISSLASSGLSAEDLQTLFPDVDFTNVDAMLEKFAAIGQYLNQFKGAKEIAPLNEMFNGAVSEEVLQIATDLNLDGAKAAWTAFAADPGAAITTDAYVSMWELSEEAKAKKAEIDAKIASYTDKDAKTGELKLTGEGIVAYVNAYNDTRPDGTKADMSSLKPEAAEAFVEAFTEIAGGADITQLTPDEIVAKVKEYAEKEGVDVLKNLKPEVLQAMVLAYSDEGASTDDLRYKWLLEHMNVNITGYTVDPAFTAPTVNGRIAITGYDLQSYLAFTRTHKDVPISGRIRLGELTDEELTAALSKGAVKYYNETGLEIPASAVPTELLTPDKLVLLGEDGTLHVLVTPEITGTGVSVREAAQALEEVYVTTSVFGNTSKHNGGPLLGKILGGSTMDWIKSFTAEAQALNRLKGSGWTLWGLLDGLNIDGLNKRMGEQFNGDTLAGLQTYVAEIVAAVQNGEAISEDDLANLKAILDFTSSLDEIGAGQQFIGGLKSILGTGDVVATLTKAYQDALGRVPDIVFGGSGINAAGRGGGGRSFGEASGDQIAAGVGAGMAEHDFSDDAETTISNVETDLNEAADINSPSKRMNPTGEFIAAGIGVGMAQYDFSGDAAATVANLESALNAAFTANSTRSVGLNAMFGMAAGVRAGQSAVISAMRSAAQNAVAAAKSALQIHSPSRVFRDEVGAMTMKGFGQGVLQETKEQAQIIRNASRYLTTEAGSSAVAATNDNRKTYNTDNSTSFSFAGATFQIRSEQDVRDLAVEIATLTRRNQRGRGLRMA